MDKEYVSGAEVLDLPPNRLRAQSPVSMPQNKRLEIERAVTPTLDEISLTAIEGAIGTLDCIIMGRKAEYGELRLVLTQLRMARVGLLKEIG